MVNERNPTLSEDGDFLRFHPDAPKTLNILGTASYVSTRRNPRWTQAEERESVSIASPEKTELKEATSSVSDPLGRVTHHQTGSLENRNRF